MEKKGAPVRQSLRRVGDVIRLAERKAAAKTAKRGGHARQAAD